MNLDKLLVVLYTYLFICVLSPPPQPQPQLMSSFTFNFDLEDDLDESFDVITPQNPPAASSIDKTLVSDSEPGGAIPAEEIPLSTLVRDNNF